MCYNVLLCVEITKSTQFLEITQTMQYTFETEKGQMVFNNHNRLLTETDYCISGKTGFTTKAGYCYVAAVERMEGECAFLSWAVGGQTIKL